MAVAQFIKTEQNPTAIQQEERETILLEAAWEIDALARILPDLVPNVEGIHGAHHAVRGISGRLLRLASALMSGLSDDGESNENLRNIVMLSSGQG